MPNDGQRRELVRGELRTMAPAGFEHGDIGLNLGGTLQADRPEEVASEIRKALQYVAPEQLIVASLPKT